MPTEIKPEQVPQSAAYEVFRRFEMDTEREAAEAIAAALNAWPGMQTGSDNGETPPTCVYLPLTTQEGRDE